MASVVHGNYTGSLASQSISWYGRAKLFFGY